MTVSLAEVIVAACDEALAARDYSRLRAQGWQPAITAPDDEAILVYAENVGVIVGYKDAAGDQYWWLTDGGQPLEENGAVVTHWQPLPAPPKPVEGV